MSKRHIILVEDEFFLKHLNVFSDPEFCKVTKTIIEDDMFKDDALYKDLVAKKKKAEIELRNYEFNKRHNHK